MTLDYWAHRFWDDPKLADEVVMADEDYQAELAAMEAESIASEAARAAEVSLAEAGAEVPEAAMKVPVPAPDDEDAWETVFEGGGN